MVPQRKGVGAVAGGRSDLLPGEEPPETPEAGRRDGGGHPDGRGEAGAEEIADKLFCDVWMPQEPAPHLQADLPPPPPPCSEEPRSPLHDPVLDGMRAVIAATAPAMHNGIVA